MESALSFSYLIIGNTLKTLAAQWRKFARRETSHGRTYVLRADSGVNN